jgi:O-antigen/teichoic acid export membrane protein
LEPALYSNLDALNNPPDVPRSLKKSLGLNFAGRIWAGVVSFLATPLYLHLLGREAYGLVGFGLLLQVVLGFFGVGLADSANRVAASPERDGKTAVATRLFMLVRLAWVTGLGLGVILASASGWLARHWLTLETLSPENATLSIRLMAALIALQVPVNLYVGVFLGSRRTLAANLIFAGGMTMQSLITIGALLSIAPTVEVFFAAQVVALFITAVAAHLLFREKILDRGAPAERMTWARVRASFLSSAGMTGVAFTGMILGQADRIILSRTLRLDDFALYSIAVALANSLYFLIGPVQTSYYPEFSRCIAPEHRSELAGLYHQACQRMAVLVLPFGAILAIFSREVLELWTSNPDVAKHAALMVSLLVAVRVIGAMNTMPYSLQFSHGWFGLVMGTNAAAIALLLPVLYLLAVRFGGVGAAGGYLLVALPFLGWIVWRMHRRLLPGELGRWIWRDTGPSLVLAVALVGLWKLAEPAGLARLGSFLWIASAGVSTFAIVAFANPSLRAQFRSRVHELRVTRGLA